MEMEEIESRLESCKMVHKETIHAALHNVQKFAFYDYSFTPEIFSTSPFLNSCFFGVGGLQIKRELQPLTHKNDSFYGREKYIGDSSTVVGSSSKTVKKPAGLWSLH